MQILEFLKSRFSGLKKGGEHMDSIADLTKIDTVQSPIMREKTREWWNIFQGIFPQEKTHKNFKPLPTAYVSTAYLAQLVTGEIKLELADLDSALPVSLFANSVGTLHEIDAAHSEYIAEFRKMRAKVFADETVLHGKEGIPDDYFVIVDPNGMDTVDKQIMTYAPQIREEAHKAAINTELRLYEVQIGVSCGTFTFDSAKGLVTATQVLSEDRTTFNTVAQLQRQLRPVLEAVAEITANLARFYGFNVVDGKPAIEFGDSVFEDTGTEFSRRFQMVQAGLLKPEEFNAWYFGVPLDKAREMLPEMTTVFGGDE